MKKIIIILSLIILSIVAVLYNKMCTLEEEVGLLSYNQSLILCQVQDSEKEIVAVENDVDKLINKYSKQYGVDKNLVHAIAIVESGKSKNAPSNGSAQGIMQIKENTSRGVGVKNVHIMENNIKGACAYLRYLQDKFKNEDKVISAYNQGEGGLIRNGIINKYYVKKVKHEKHKLDNGIK